MTAKMTKPTTTERFAQSRHVAIGAGFGFSTLKAKTMTAPMSAAIGAKA